MKFTCDSCGAQYMISDDKVGPAGAKVRCKKCGHVIVVRRAAEPAAPAKRAGAARAQGDTAPAVAAPRAVAGGAAAPSAAATSPGIAVRGAGAPGPGLDAELGSAFDHAFGDTPPSTAAPPAAAPGAGGDLAATQAMGAEDAAKVFAQAAAPSATEWYVAIGQAQVGPLPLAEVKKKWEAGDVGPDSLVWRPGMGDWAPLTTVPDLAGYLAPVPRAAARTARAQAAEPSRSEPRPAEPSPEVAWKPVGASALAALASAEIASRSPEARPAAPRPSGGVKSLVDALPDGGGVDPTGALPLNIKALESSGERKLEPRSSVARGAAQLRQRRSTTRAAVAGAVIGVVVVAGAGAGVMWAMGLPPFRRQEERAGPAVAVPLPPPPAARAAPPPAAAPAPPPAVASAPAAPAAPPAAASPTPSPAPAKPARAEPPRDLPRREAPRVAAAPPPPPPAPAPSRKKGDSLLDFESNDSALDDALGGGSAPPGRSVYVPPARAGGGALPEKVSAGDINGAVAQRVDALRRCVSEQRAREPDATGTIKMRWIIQGDGGVRDVKCITPEYAQGHFAACIGGIVKAIRFPRSATTGQEVTFPFNF